MQYLINLLSPRLKAYKAREGIKTGSGGTFGLGNTKGGDVQAVTMLEGAVVGGGMGDMPFSAVVLEQTERDLRKAVSSLSFEITRMLRRS